MKNVIEISDETLGTLSACRIDGSILYLPDGQLERKAYDAVNAVLVAMGGKWDRKSKGHVFPGDPTDRLEDVLMTGKIGKPNAHEFYATPYELVDKMLDLVDLYVGVRVLEPSVGNGALAIPAAEIVGPENVWCIDVQDQFRSYLLFHGIDMEMRDFLTVEPRPVDVVLMNPPFSRQQDIAHVEHAFRFLRPGGRLVAIMSNGITFRKDERAKRFRRLVLDNGYWEDNPDGSFLEGGTGVRTVTVLLDKGNHAG